jgi:4-hydroxythreonine-4-phosphate dehydrogenase
MTLGDPCGIGPEITIKALKRGDLLQKNRFIIFGCSGIFSQYKFPKSKNLSLYPCEGIASHRYKPGQPDKDSASASITYLKEAVAFLKGKSMSALVTAPVCKESINHLGLTFHGHTEFLAEHFNVTNYGMMFVADTLKTMIVTRHIAINKVSSSINKKNVAQTIKLTHAALKKFFQIPHPRIAVCGLNPHAGEGGVIGSEETTIICPVLKTLRHKGINVSGPFAADTLFVPQNTKSFDAVVAMYHDQGLIPVKTLYFHDLVNLTVGLPFIRTSPAHGTAFDIAGKHKADASSMISAIKLTSSLLAQTK